MPLVPRAVQRVVSTKVLAGCVLLLLTTHVLLSGNGSNNNVTQSKVLNLPQGKEYCDRVHARMKNITSSQQITLNQKGDTQVVKIKLQTETQEGTIIDFPYVIIPFLNCLDQEDPVLAELINEVFTIKPNKLPYNFEFVPPDELKNLKEWFNTANNSDLGGKPCEGKYKKDFRSSAQICAVREQHSVADYVDKFIFKRGLRNGFFIESGSDEASLDASVSVLFELHYNWTGLLIESLPDSFHVGTQTNRKVKFLHGCLGMEDHPHVSKIAMAAMRTVGKSKISRMSSIMAEGEIGDFIEIQCFPMYSILKSVGNPTVNLWILDIEGFEFPVLKNIPWDKVEIEVMVVETSMAGEMVPGTRDDIIRFVTSKGYVHHKIDASHFSLFGKSYKPADDIFISHKAMMKYDITSLPSRSRRRKRD